ncbi:MAG: CRISPR-associated endoribonuclease Cas6 [Synechococcales cyanobacterium T60_A2020_003]|nr:CRISPR-associated endoribonuclease Cas6 [Synechococcales cyanobacterium T60_A2020_003]
MSHPSPLTIPNTTELIGLKFSLQALTSDALYPQYTIGLHAWFLDQIRQIDPALSTYLHDGESEKPFTISTLSGQLRAHGQHLHIQKGTTYDWQITALSQNVVKGIAVWQKHPPTQLTLKTIPFQIQSITLSPSPTTYRTLWDSARQMRGPVHLSFTSPTSFRRKGHHFPLPVPNNLFHSYLRRWNDFSGLPFEQDPFLNWIDETVIIQRLQIETQKVAVGKRGSVTGFVGGLSLNLSSHADKMPEFRQLFYALIQLAPYCGTGHKTTFGLGQTQLGWEPNHPQGINQPTDEERLSDRITYLTHLFLSQRKRTGGDRARQTAETWATILARREQGDSLLDVAGDLNMPYETVKTYAKLARRSLRQ